MTFPIKKRINTELLIDRKQGLYKQKGDKEMNQETFWPHRRGYAETAEKLSRNANITAACLDWLTLDGRKDKLLAACLKRFWAWKAKNIIAQKRGYLSK